MTRTTYKLKDLRRDCTKRVKFEAPRIGHTTVPDGHEIADIEVTLDLEAIAKWLGKKAMLNKTGKATAIHGDIKAYVVRRVRVQS